MSASRLDGDFHVAGNLSANTMTIPDGAISNAKVVASAGIVASKLQHQHRRGYGQPNTAATTETRSIAVIFGATGTLFDFRAGSIAKAVGDSTVTVDLKKNGASVLNTIITLDTANTNRVAEAATFVPPRRLSRAIGWKSSSRPLSEREHCRRACSPRLRGMRITSNAKSGRGHSQWLEAFADARWLSTHHGI